MEIITYSHEHYPSVRLTYVSARVTARINTLGAMKGRLLMAFLRHEVEVKFRIQDISKIVNHNWAMCQLL
jgi:hypothetical protein